MSELTARRNLAFAGATSVPYPVLSGDYVEHLPPADYTQAVGKEVRVDETQPVVNDLLAANLIMRKGHDTCGVTDPFVQEIWREKKAFGDWV